MRGIAPLLLGIVLLMMALRVARQYFAGMGIPSGWVSVPLLKAGKATVRAGWRGVVGLVRVLTKTRRPRIRRPAGPSPVRRVR